MSRATAKQILQTSKGLRRLASDHASLHSKGLPPNYLFPPGKDDDFSDLTSLTVLLAGGEGTAFSHGVYTLELRIPPTYPNAAPTAHFRNKIFHPNVDPSSGAVCVETLKRDWKPELTLRDILITINCLLVYPNPASALNAEAGRLVEEDFAEYERKAHLWARMHAAIPPSLRAAVDEARSRGDREQALGPSVAVDKRKRKDRERRVEVEDVFVREDSIQTTPPIKQHAAMAAPPLPPRGLGIDIMPESSLNAVSAETPTQAPPAARRRRKPSQDESTATVPTSFESIMPTPTPAVRSLVHSNPSTPRLGQPEAKRRRVTPENEQDIPSLPEVAQIAIATAADECPWLHWQSRSPLSSPEEALHKKRRRIVERKKLKSVGGSLALYNAGLFGPRAGVQRL
jgi:ubiquitin-conjugating enzyme E2 S